MFTCHSFCLITVDPKIMIVSIILSVGVLTCYPGILDMPFICRSRWIIFTHIHEHIIYISPKINVCQPTTTPRSPCDEWINVTNMLSLTMAEAAVWFYLMVISYFAPDEKCQTRINSFQLRSSWNEASNSDWIVLASRHTEQLNTFDNGCN